MKQARRSFSKEPYNCLKPWSENTFCQCGGDGVVFTDGSLEKSLSDPKEQVETIKTVLGEPTKKKHYRTAFFEAFPKDPSCFIRGEGTTVEEAEAKAWEKYEKILACNNHEWDRRNRTDGYVFCTKCPLSGRFLEPTTCCHVCQTPTTRSIHDEDKKYYCIVHYLELPVEQVVFENSWGFSKEEQTHMFLEEQLVYQELVNNNYVINEKSWQEFDDYFIRYRGHVSAQYRPLFGEPLKTHEEIHEIVKGLIPHIVLQILIKMEKDKTK